MSHFNPDLNLIHTAFSLLLDKVIVPTDFHHQAGVVREMLGDDVTGVVGALTEFSVNSAMVNYSIETKNEELNKIFAKWLKQINVGFDGKIPSGISTVAREYFKERWQGASFPVLKIAQWEEIDGLELPTKIFFVDGASIYAKDPDEKDQNLKLINYEYFLGKDMTEGMKLDEDVIFSRPYGRLFDKYPIPYLIKNGIYHNWKIVQSLKDKQSKILDQIIPYLLMIKKGSEGLELQNRGYTDEELQKVNEQMQNLLEKLQTFDKHIKAPIRTTNFDEEIKHLIPDLENIFKNELFIVAERNILAGLGFIDIAEGVSDSRRESILNPKPFIEEVKAGVNGFEQVLIDLLWKIKERNENHKKYMNADPIVTHTKVQAFLTDKFRDQMRQLWQKGKLSNRTYAEIVGDVQFEIEHRRRKQEAKDGIEEDMYPPVDQNQEQHLSPEETERLKKFNKTPKQIEKEENTTEDKIDPQEKQEFDVSKAELVGAPFNKIADLPKQVKNNMSTDLQGTFLRVFNNAFKTTQSDTSSFRIAWSVIRRIGRKNKKGIWVRKQKRSNGKLKPVTITKAMLEQVLQEEEKLLLDETLKTQKLVIAKKQIELLTNLLEKPKDK